MIVETIFRDGSHDMRREFIILGKYNFKKEKNFEFLTI